MRKILFTGVESAVQAPQENVHAGRMELYHCADYQSLAGLGSESGTTEVIGCIKRLVESRKIKAI